jgi:hypothetical protein
MADLSRKLAELEFTQHTPWVSRFIHEGSVTGRMNTTAGKWAEPPRWCNGIPFYCDCGCGGPEHECELPSSTLESLETAQRRHAKWVLKQEFDK